MILFEKAEKDRTSTSIGAKIYPPTQDVRRKEETVWLTQKALAELFGGKVPAVNKHLKNIFESGKLFREATVSKMEIAHPDGVREVTREVEFYNLDTIIAVGYRVGAMPTGRSSTWRR